MPKGSLQEQGQKKSQVRIIVFSILAIHVVLLGVLLIQGCRRDEPAPIKPEVPTLPPIDTNTFVPPPPPPNSLTGLPPVTTGLTTPAPFTPTTPTTPITPTTPTTPTTPADLGGGSATEHVIVKGDSFAILAKKYGVSIKAIQQANPGVDSKKLKIGQKISIPPKPPGGATAPAPTGARSEVAPASSENIYVVKKGDTLTKIAKVSHVSVKSLRADNGLRTDQLKVGQKLKVPAKAGGAAPADSAATPAPAVAPVLSVPAPISPITPTTPAPGTPTSP